jgi:hypothetical protein
MAITTLDGYIGSLKQQITWAKTASITAVAGMPFSNFGAAGFPGAGTLSAGNTANGIVPTDATTGYPVITAFSGGNKGYLSRVSYLSSVTCELAIYDRIFSCGAYAHNATQTLGTQPSFAARVPNTDYAGCELWYEQVTGGTLVQNVAVTYLDQGGNAGTTGTVAAPAVMIAGRCMQLPLAAGDSGVSRVDTVTGTVASGGTFNINVLRPLWKGNVYVANTAYVDDLIRTGLPELFADSSLFVMVRPLSTATGLPSMTLEVCNG